MTARSVLTVLVGLPLALFIVLFAVANRQGVTLAFDPFAPETPALSVTLPLFAVVLLSVMLGVVVGGAASWAKQGKWRKEARRRRQQVEALEAETEQARREAAAARRSAGALPAPSRAAA
jgi:uncharacterized integral membrane protein